jgi:hypothetical protein
MLSESDVISAVCQYLKSQGFQITRALSEIERGIDIEAITPDGKTKISIEAKGETSSKSTTARFGKPFNSNQSLIMYQKHFTAPLETVP